MEQKDVTALVLLLAGTAAGITLTCASRRMRDVFFFAMVPLAAITESIDVNFVSREWYRGTTCGFEVSLVDVLSISLLVSALVAPRPGEKRWYWPASLGWMIVLFLFASFCVAIAEPKLFGLFALSKMIRGMIMFLAAAFYIRSERELKIFLFALAIIVCWEGIHALEQRYVKGTNRVFATLDDSNSLSMYLCMTAPIFVVVLTSRLPLTLKATAGLTIALACIGVILTISRAGVAAMAVVLLGAAATTIRISITPRKVIIAGLVMIGATGVIAKSWRTLSARFHESTLAKEYEDKNSQGRGFYIRMAEAIMEHRTFGVGPNNWSYWVSNRYGPRYGWRYSKYPGTDKPPKFVVPEGSHVDDPQAAPAHSLAALTAGEMGIPGLVLFSFLWLRWFQMGASFFWKRTTDPMRRMGIGFFFATCGIFFQSLTEWVYHQTPIYFTFHIILGALASLYYLKKQEHRAARRERARAFDAECEMNAQPVLT